MSGRYTYDLNALAMQGGIPRQPVFTNLNPFAYRPTVTVMDAYEVNQNSPIPAQAVLAAAKDHATKIRDKKVPYPASADERTYEGVDHWDIPKSRELTQAAETAGLGDVYTIFDDFLTAEFYRGALRPGKRVEDHTVPKTIAAMKLHVDLLVRAFKSTNNCDDNEGMIRPFNDRRHDSKLVECLCWAIVKACIFRSKSDEPLLTAYEPHKAKNSLGLDTFDKRFDAIATAMTRSKTICKHLFDAPYINTFVDDPLRSIRRVDANRDLNRQKADVMKKGKALQQHIDHVNGVPAATKKSSKTRKRSVSTAGFDDNDARTKVQTPPTAPVDTTRMTQSALANGRVTRRMSRLMAVQDPAFGAPRTPVRTPRAASSYLDFSPPSADGHFDSSPPVAADHFDSSPPVAAGHFASSPPGAGAHFASTPPGARTDLASSPMSSHTEIKNESSPLRYEQSYSMNSYNGNNPMAMYNNGYGRPLMQGIDFAQAGPRFPTPMGANYPFGYVNRGAYLNGSNLNFVPPTTAAYRNGFMNPEEVTMSMSGPVSLHLLK